MLSLNDKAEVYCTLNLMRGNSMAIEYKVRISEKQRKLIMRALGTAIVNNRRSSGAVLNTAPDEWIELIGMFGTLNSHAAVADDQPEHCRYRRWCPHVRRSHGLTLQ
jgi:hypothetical protein